MVVSINDFNASSVGVRFKDRKICVDNSLEALDTRIILDIK